MLALVFFCDHDFIVEHRWIGFSLILHPYFSYTHLLLLFIIQKPRIMEDHVKIFSPVPDRSEGYADRE